MLAICAGPIVTLALRALEAASAFAQRQNGPVGAGRAAPRLGREPVLPARRAMLTAWWQQGVARLGHYWRRENRMITLYGFGTGLRPA